MNKYAWGESLQEVNITFPVPPGTKSRFIICDMKKNRLKVGIKGQAPVIDGELFKSMKVDDCFWSLEDQKSISILLTKQNKMEWWKYLVKGEPEIDTQKAEPENSKLSDLDPKTRSTVDKMMKEIALYTASKFNSKFSWFDLDGDIDPLFKAAARHLSTQKKDIEVVESVVFQGNLVLRGQSNISVLRNGACRNYHITWNTSLLSCTISLLFCFSFSIMVIDA